MLFVTGMGLQFHFGQYVEYLGYGVDTLGRILSISMVGTLLITHSWIASMLPGYSELEVYLPLMIPLSHP